MGALDFFRLEETRKAILRFARAAAMPVAIHPVRDETEGLRVLSEGTCAACSLIGKTPGGREACAQSRIAAQQRSYALRRPALFTCHAGLAGACVFLFAEDGIQYTLTLGPFCPAEEPRGFESQLAEVLEGYAAEDEDAPSGDDIRITPTSSVLALGEWISELVEELWSEYSEPTEYDEDLDADAGDAGAYTPRNKRRRRNHDSTKAMVMALVGGDLPRFREILRTAIQDAPDGAEMRARAGEVLFAILGHLLEMKTISEPEASLLVAGMHTILTSDDPDQCVEACAKYLRRITRDVRLDHSGEDPLAKVYQSIRKRLPERVNMVEIAMENGLSETSLRQMLKERINTTFPKLVMGLRLERAKKMLSDTKLEIHEIARRVGIDDLSNFGKAFRSVTGMSPGEYRIARKRTRK